jgi:hypothetical protein
MKIRHHDHQYLEAELTPPDARWRVRTIGLAIMLALTVIYFGYRLLIPKTTIPDAVFYAIGVILMPLTGFAVNSSLTYETEILRLDRVQNQFRIVQRNIMGQRVLKGSLHSIADVRMTISPTEDDYLYQVSLEIRGQPSIPLTANQQMSTAQLMAFDPVREFLGLPPLPR